MLSLTLSKEALNLTKRDMQKQNQSSQPLRFGLWPMLAGAINSSKKSQTISY